MISQAKVYVAVIASFSEDGNLYPRRLRWEDGREYSIEKVLDVRPAAALKTGGQGDRYTVQINCFRQVINGPNFYFKSGPLISTL